MVIIATSCPIQKMNIHLIMSALLSLISTLRLVRSSLLAKISFFFRISFRSFHQSIPK